MSYFSLSSFNEEAFNEGAFDEEKSNEEASTENPVRASSFIKLLKNNGKNVYPGKSSKRIDYLESLGLILILTQYHAAPHVYQIEIYDYNLDFVTDYDKIIYGPLCYKPRVKYTNGITTYTNSISHKPGTYRYSFFGDMRYGRKYASLDIDMNKVIDVYKYNIRNYRKIIFNSDVIINYYEKTPYLLCISAYIDLLPELKALIYNYIYLSSYYYIDEF